MHRALMILCFGLLPLSAAPSVKELVGVPAAELPEKAAALVTAQEGLERAKMATAVVEAVHAARPESVVPVVGAIALAAPRAAADAANKASSLQPSNAVAIAGAAAHGAPGYAPLIVHAVCPHAPELWSEITIEIAIAAPGQAHAIVYALNQAIPSVRDYVERAKSNVQSGRTDRPSVALLMYETEEIIEAEGEGDASEVIRKLHLEEAEEAKAKAVKEAEVKAVPVPVPVPEKEGK